MKWRRVSVFFFAILSVSAGFWLATSEPQAESEVVSIVGGPEAKITQTASGATIVDLTDSGPIEVYLLKCDSTEVNAEDAGPITCVTGARMIKEGVEISRWGYPEEKRLTKTVTRQPDGTEHMEFNW